MCKDKVKSVLDWPIPTTLKELQSFLGLANFYRRFVKDYSRITRPMTVLQKKGMPFIFGKAAVEAFDHLKKAFTSAPVLRPFDPSLETMLETDSSDAAIAGVLSQKFEGRWHPIAFMSRTLKAAELNYPIGDKELLAIVRCVELWRHYFSCLDQPFRIITDHKNLTYFLKPQKQLGVRLLNAYNILNDHKYTLEYRPGDRNGKADALSRRPDLLKEGRQERGEEKQVLQPIAVLATNLQDEEVVEEGYAAPIQ
jgi:hypothetical protein